MGTSLSKLSTEINRHTYGRIAASFNILLLLLTSPVYAATAIATPSTICDGSNKRPCIVQDTKNNTSTVRNYRDSFMFAQAYQGNTKGLSSLNMSGSAMPSAEGWKTLIKHIKESGAEPPHRIYVIDLRQESHGYLNDNAITLVSEHDWINAGKSRSKALAAERRWLSQLQSKKIINDVLTPRQFKTQAFSSGMTVNVMKISNEEKVVQNNDVRYIRFMVTDHLAPTAAEVDRFVEIFRQLPPNTWLHFHCRNGDGRTATFMAMYDMLRNATKVSLDDIIKRQASVAPYYHLFAVSSSNPILARHYQDRADFLRGFYEYARAVGHDYSGSWSEWI